NGRWIRRKAPHAPVPAASDQRLAPENALAPTVAAPLRATPVVAPAASRANAAPKPDPPRRPAGSRLVHQRCALVHGRSSMPSDPQLQQFADTIARLHEAGQSYNALPMTVVRRFPWQHDLISLLHFVCELTPDFLFRAAFWRIGSRSRGISAKRSPHHNSLPCRSAILSRKPC